MVKLAVALKMYVICGIRVAVHKKQTTQKTKKTQNFPKLRGVTFFATMLGKENRLLVGLLPFGSSLYEEFSLHYNSMHDSIYKER